MKLGSNATQNREQLFLILFLLLIPTIIILGMFGSNFVHNMETVNTEMVTVEIPESATYDQLVEILSNKGVLTDTWIFKNIVLKRNSYEVDIKSGQFEINPNENLYSLGDKLVDHFQK